VAAIRGPSTRKAPRARRPRRCILHPNRECRCIRTSTTGYDSLLTLGTTTTTSPRARDVSALGELRLGRYFCWTRKLRRENNRWLGVSGNLCNILTWVLLRHTWRVSVRRRQRSDLKKPHFLKFPSRASTLSSRTGHHCDVSSTGVHGHVMRSCTSC